MTKLKLVWIFFIPLFLSAQHKNEPFINQGVFAKLISEEFKARQVFCHIGLKTDEQSPLQGVLPAALAAIGYSDLPASNFHIEYQKTNVAGTYIQFRFAPGGIPAFSQYIKVYYDKNNTLREVFYLLDGCRTWSQRPFASETSVRGLSGSLEILSLEKKWFFNGKDWQGAWSMELLGQIAADAERRLYGEDLSLLFSERMMQFYTSHLSDTTVRGMVFRPDPLTSAEVPYGGRYQDYNDADSPAVNNERVWVPLQVDFRNDSFFLEDAGFYFVELEGPEVSTPVRTDTLFVYNRSQDEFEFVNALYHLQSMKKRVKSLGFNLPGFRIQVDPHGSNGLDVSGFSTFHTPPALIFGDGGIDDAEDADVLVHEFGHALSHGAAPNTSVGLERKSIEEGTCDYFAMSYSRSINPFNWQKTFNWDGNLTWQGRVANSPKVYPTNFNSDYYNNAEIWTAALSEIYDSLGADVTDELILSSLYHQVENMSFEQRCLSIMLTDTVLNGASNVIALHYFFHKRGFLGPLNTASVIPSNWRILNSYGFARGEYVEIDFGRDLVSGKVQLVDMQGRVVIEETISSQHNYHLDSKEIKKGLYVLHLQTHTGPGINIKLVRY